MQTKSLHFRFDGDALDQIAQLQATLGCASSDQAISVALGIALAVGRLIDQEGVLTVIDPTPGLPEGEREVAFDALPGRRLPHRNAA